jgi:hypothetical protein
LKEIESFVVGDHVRAGQETPACCRQANDGKNNFNYDK